MIKQEVVDKILDAARIEEVVGEFVSLKKRGSSLIGLCPFHNEKTPSFNVSVSKGIYKCFGCGAGGDAVRFVMDHEKYSYPEALRFLAGKYGIEVEETEQNEEQLQLRDHRESLMIVTQWAGEFFTDQLWNTDEGQTVGLNYFKERGYREDTIRKFGLGYAPEAWTALTEKAQTQGYKENYLTETGLIVKREDGSSYDRFRARIIFPIHNLTGRVLGFGGRTLKTDKKVPKYVNSPESEIYHKSNVLYGLYFAKKAITQVDKCYLVEGYADVISMHQAGVENSVSSSGTSLTTGQIQLVSRYTKNITLLFDGDPAGIKASLRGVDMLLEEGLNVKIVRFPEGEDPDSYVRKFGSSDFQDFVGKQEEDFITFKTHVLLDEAANDPIKRADTIREIVESIALIPDEIKVSVFIRECSLLLDIEERILLHELNKIRISKSRKKGADPAQSPESLSQTSIGPDGPLPAQPAGQIPGVNQGIPKDQSLSTIILQEREFVRVLLTYGHFPAEWEAEGHNLPVAPLLINSIGDIYFEDQTCAAIINIYKDYITREQLPEERLFVSNPDQAISALAVSCLASKYNISPNWNDDKRKIYVPEEKEQLEELVYTSVYRLKKRWIESQMAAVRESLKEEQGEEQTASLLRKYQAMKDALKIIGDKLGTIILK